MTISYKFSDSAIDALCQLRDLVSYHHYLMLELTGAGPTYGVMDSEAIA
jgi:hypothetical protein